MTTSGEQPQDRPAARPGSYDEIAPGVPRYGQYAPEGWVPPQEASTGQGAGNPASDIPAAPAYPGHAQASAQNTAVKNSEPHLAPPRLVLLSARLIFWAGIIQAVSTLALLAVMMIPSVKESVATMLQDTLKDFPELATMYDDPSLVNAGLFMGFLFSLAMTLGYFWIARNVRKGARWARTTGTVLAVVSLSLLLQASPLAMVQVGLGIAAIVILYRSPAKEFFDSRSGR